MIAALPKETRMPRQSIAMQRWITAQRLRVIVRARQILRRHDGRLPAKQLAEAIGVSPHGLCQYLAQEPDFRKEHLPSDGAKGAAVTWIALVDLRYTPWQRTRRLVSGQ